MFFSLHTTNKNDMLPEESPFQVNADLLSIMLFCRYWVYTNKVLYFRMPKIFPEL